MRVDMQDQEGLARFAAQVWDMEDTGLAPDMILLGIYDDVGKVRAAFGVNAVYGHFCSMHIASDGSRAWATPDVLRLVFGYVFQFRGLKRAAAVVRAHDLKTQIFCLKLGFRFEGIAAAGSDDGSDGVIFGLLATNCKWIQDHG